MVMVSSYSYSPWLRSPYSFSPSSCLRSASVSYPSQPLRKKLALKRIFRAVAVDKTLSPEADPMPKLEQNPYPEGTIVAPVSPSDFLKILFKAEGTMDDSSFSKVSKALEGKEGVSDLKVQNVEGIASIELTQQTTVQATGAASNLVEIILSTGFKLLTLSLRFEDNEDLTAKHTNHRFQAVDCFKFG